MIAKRTDSRLTGQKLNRTTFAECWGFLVIALVFVLWRVPVMYLDPGGQDEEYYAIPGLTILENGIPRLPHVPARNPESVFLRADECLFSEPPVYFFLQAVFYFFLPDVYGTGRLATAFSALILLFFLYWLARRVGASASAALWSIGLLSMSRWFFFPAIAARPDMLCAALGVVAVLTTFAWRNSGQKRWLVVTGLAIGLGGLSHVFAIVYAVQIAVWIFLSSRKFQRITYPAIVAATALATAALWLILILQFPDVFVAQFGNQFFHGIGGSFFWRIIWPWESLAYHGQMLWKHIGPWQLMLVLSGWHVCRVLGHREQRSELVTLWWLTTTSFWLIAALVGPHHPVFGYWAFTAALMLVGLGWWIDEMIIRCNSWGFTGRVLGCVGGCLLVASMVPGSGLRTLVTHIQHRGDINYNAPQFAKSIVRELPSNATCAVDTQFVLDFLVAGRRTLVAEVFPMYFRLDQHPYDYLIVSRHGLDTGIARQLNARLLWTRGNREDPFACYVEVYAAE